jgi:PilZ domain
MSIIWDLLSNEIAEPERSSPGDSSAERRKSSRHCVYVPIFVYGYTSGKEPFHEETNTLEISGTGGLLHLQAEVRQGQTLLLVNRLTDSELECRVVRVAKRPKRTDVGIALAYSSPEFWSGRRKSAVA